MAFGHEDTDHWYKSTLKPLLRKHGLDPRRVDLITHNDNVDKRILQELGEADLVVADLTYARPSVYFEAGHAHGRELPVVYTARSDHLSPFAKSDELRVHFDLLMRNIIDWKQPGDQSFIRRMEQRLTLVTSPLRKDRAERKRKSDAAKAFAAMSQADQLKGVIAQVEKLGQRHRFSTRTFLDTGRGIEYRSYFPGVAVVVGSAFHGGQLEGLQCIIRESFRKTDLKTAALLVRRPQFNLQLQTGSGVVTRVADLVVIISLRPIPLARVTAALDSFNVLDQAKKLLRRVAEEDFPRQRTPGYRVIRKGEYGNDYMASSGRPGADSKYLSAIDDPRGAGKGLILVTRVPRRVDVCVVDLARSLEDVRERVAAAISRLRS